MITGIVTHGQGIGSKELLPTINIEVRTGTLPTEHGVYLCHVYHEDMVWKGVANIGTRPTVTSSVQIVLEIHVLDLSESWYDKEVTVDLLSYVRPEYTFTSLDELRTQIMQDVAYARSWFARN